MVERKGSTSSSLSNRGYLTPAKTKICAQKTQRSLGVESGGCQQTGAAEAIDDRGLLNSLCPRHKLLNSFDGRLPLHEACQN